MSRLTQLWVALVISIFFIAGCSSDKADKKLQIGDHAPGFQLTDIDDQEFSLNDYQGMPVIIRFWSTDCKYCRADTPIFNTYFNRYSRENLQVFYINTIPEDPYLAGFVKDLEIGFPVLLDHGGKVAEKYNIRLQPQTIILDPSHRIIAAILGGVSDEELTEILGKYL